MSEINEPTEEEQMRTIKPYLDQLEGFKTEALGKQMFLNGGVPLVPSN